jgi:hypothetical protein
LVTAVQPVIHSDLECLDISPSVWIEEYIGEIIHSPTLAQAGNIRSGETPRIATGVPAGSDIEYADEVTMARALEGRREL